MEEFLSLCFCKKVVTMKKDVIEYLDRFLISDETLKSVMKLMGENFDDGLSSDPDIYMYSPIRMLPTFVTDTPKGSESGLFYALDLGGSFLRFLSIDLHEGSMKKFCCAYEIPYSIMNGTGNQLYEFIASKLADGLKKLDRLNQFIPYIGFTFSFPLNQLSLTSGKVIQWTKGFDIPDAVGKDVGVMMKEACHKIEGLNIGEFVLINDTTGTLMSGAFDNANVVAGIINGTGTNACYIEKIENVKKWKNDTSKPKQVLINTEWGAFGEKTSLVFNGKDIRTFADYQLDKESLHPGRHLFEKMISGMYLGEIARLCLIEMANMNLFVDKKLIENFNEPYGLETASLSMAHGDKDIFKEHLLKNYKINVNEEDLIIIDALFKIIVYRAALLTASGLATIIKKVNKTDCAFAVDGSMFRKHPTYIHDVEMKTKQLIEECSCFRIHLTDDGSGKGAALAAAVAMSANENH